MIIDKIRRFLTFLQNNDDFYLKICLIRNERQLNIVTRFYPKYNNFHLEYATYNIFIILNELTIVMNWLRLEFSLRSMN